MTREQFIEKIAPIVVKYAPQYNILCPSAVIAQATLESDGGNSELAINANNYFGLKYRVGRCPSACGIYLKKGSEQNADGSYSTSAMSWMKFANMNDGIKGYFDFINIPNYSKCKGVSDPKTYLENIKAAGYATSIKYVSNLMNVINKYNLTQYDDKPNMQKLYCVQTGAFKSIINAKKLQKQLEDFGFKVIVKYVDGLYKCQIGAFKNKSNADDLLESVKSKGFDAFLLYS